ncbi:protein arginine methyltransferase NDUFAF7, mitochondrial [Periophthalmus magnuspinnatus]|uniref:protein arginine methyltransferase NDUFAF7, mitochondrial n=1 Tax=Periophthalmus magnuspinnatus TaxID=409849 RepID=UPI00145B9978|nr:protein arginine methyltransferase NDUFAF7, mitochondrial [Periophthalmus magnuspinnatus]
MRLFVGLKTRHLAQKVFSPSAAVRWPRPLCTCSPAENKPHPSMLKHLTSKIKSTGPISVAEYMREVLTNPVTGYYVRNNMLGVEGDFITSPEISQMFGELIGVWIISEWMAAGHPEQVQIVELGPGKGSLTKDILRVLHQLRSVMGGASVSVHLVEVSPVLSALQAQALTGSESHVTTEGEEPVYRRGNTPDGLQVSWYKRIQDVPPGFSVHVAQEFFDALPIHKFQKTPRGWREVLVDIDPDRDEQLRFVLSPNATLASTTLIQPGERREHVEVCAEGGVVLQHLSKRISERGGAALIADYGHDGTKTDTFRGFKDHQLHDVLTSPGSADLTADVDFSYLRRCAGGVACVGPVSQNSFLRNMGIDARLQVLLKNCPDLASRCQLLRSYHTLMDPGQMGERFQFFGVLPLSRVQRPRPQTGLNLDKTQRPAPLPVAGFTELKYA